MQTFVSISIIQKKHTNIIFPNIFDVEFAIPLGFYAKKFPSPCIYKLLNAFALFRIICIGDLVGNANVYNIVMPNIIFYHDACFIAIDNIVDAFCFAYVALKDLWTNDKLLDVNGEMNTIMVPTYLPTEIME